MPSNEVVLHLQEMLLKAVLSGESLPGHDQPIKLPDQEFIKRQPVIYLADKNLQGSSSSLKVATSKPIRIVSTETLGEESKMQGNITYLQFQPPEVTEDRVRLTLEARIATGERDQKELGLSSIQIAFSKVGDEWEVVDGPVSSAA